MVGIYFILQKGCQYQIWSSLKRSEKSLPNKTSFIMFLQVSCSIITMVVRKFWSCCCFIVLKYFGHAQSSHTKVNWFASSIDVCLHNKINFILHLFSWNIGLLGILQSDWLRVSLTIKQSLRTFPNIEIGMESQVYLLNVFSIYNYEELWTCLAMSD